MGRLADREGIWSANDALIHNGASCPSGGGYSRPSAADGVTGLSLCYRPVPERRVRPGDERRTGGRNTIPHGSAVIHVGLHKTGTRFLQRAVLRRLETDRFAVNPEPLYGRLRDAARHPGDAERADLARVAAAETRERVGGRTLVISDPSLSGDMYSSHAGYRENLELVAELFPEARIVYFVRAHADWLQSAYRQSLKKGRGQSIERFLNFCDGRFRDRAARMVDGRRNVDALTLSFLELYRAYADRFGPERVYLFRQEDLRRRSSEVHSRLAEALGLSELPPLPARVSGNRSFSALAIRLFVAADDRPASPRGAERAGAEPAQGRMLRRRVRRLRAAFIQHVFDRLLYRDWDLLERGGMRNLLERHYAPTDRALTRVADRVLVEGPGAAARRAADEDAS